MTMVLRWNDVEANTFDDNQTKDKQHHINQNKIYFVQESVMCLILMVLGKTASEIA
mgnify:FL=1